MRTHVTVIGWLHIALNVLAVFIGLLIMFLGGLGGAVVASGGGQGSLQAGSWLAALMGIAGTFFLIVGLPGFIVGIGLVQFKPWARIGGIVISALHLVTFPVGTAIGIYSFWVLFNPETVAIFDGAHAY